jgi:hypothetical protein
VLRLKSCGFREGGGRALAMALRLNTTVASLRLNTTFTSLDLSENGM